MEKDFPEFPFDLGFCSGGEEDPVRVTVYPYEAGEDDEVDDDDDDDDASSSSPFPSSFFSSSASYSSSSSLPADLAFHFLASSLPHLNLHKCTPRSPMRVRKSGTIVVGTDVSHQR